MAAASVLSRTVVAMTTTPALTMTARDPVDVLAVVPVVLGFVPEESVVMLTFGAAHPFHARLDLPGTSLECRQAAVALGAPATHHGASRVVFVLYTDDRSAARRCARALVREFDARGIEVVGVVRADGRRWSVISVSRRSVHEGPTEPYDLSGHPFTAQAVVNGRVTLPSRAALAASVATDPAAVEEVADAVERLRKRGGGAGPPPPVMSELAGLVSERRVPTPEESAALLLAIQDPVVRDDVLGVLDRDAAREHRDVWCALVRRAPTDLVAAAASVLGFVAWLAGDGALAWCAVERAGEGLPPCTLAEVVADALEQALPPSAWAERVAEGHVR